MSAKTDYLEDAILDHVLGGSSYSAPATTYLALFTSAPGEAGGGTELTAGGFSYARQAISWGSASGGSISNDTQIDFTNTPEATITHVAIMDASSGGNMLYYGSLSSSISTSAGGQVSFEIGELTVSED